MAGTKIGNGNISRKDSADTRAVATLDGNKFGARFIGFGGKSIQRSIKCDRKGRKQT